MKHLLIFKLEGHFSKGFTLDLEIGKDGHKPSVSIQEQLFSYPKLPTIYQIWSESYRSLDGKKRVIQNHNYPTNINLDVLKQKCQQRAKNLEINLNNWLDPHLLYRLKKEYNQLEPDDEIRVIIRTSEPELTRIPWHLWRGWQELPPVEISLSSPEAKRRERTYQETVRILIILGNSDGIDVKEDERILKQFCQEAKLIVLNEPTLPILKQHLLDKRGWDIMFFSGHSKTMDDQGIIYINKTDTLNIKQLKEELHTATVGGLQIALFNSCDGLGIAKELETLNIPQVIVMREPVPDKVAQEFLKEFIKRFTLGETLYQSVRIARQKLKDLEEEYPCASWLPVIIQNVLEIPPTWQSLGAISQCPYRGLAAFRVEDARFFYGREKLTQKLAQKVKNRRIVGVVGASGSGKSSLVFAGLIPYLSSNGKWQVISCRPSNNPFQSLAIALVSTFCPQLDKDEQYLLESELEQDEKKLQSFLLSYSEQDNQSSLLLIIDQFEELYILNSDLSSRKVFLNGLLNAVNNVPRLTILLTLRADCYGEVLAYTPLAGALQDRILNVAPMNPEELERAIVMPAQKMNVELELALIECLIKTVFNSSGDLTLLEFTLTQLWAAQRDHTLTYRGYQNIGGLEGALANHAEAVYEQLNIEEQKRLQYIFTQLVQPSGNINTRRLASRAEIGLDNWDLVRHLASVRLVVTNRNELTGEETVELIHEALIKYWRRLTLWIESSREFRQWQEQLRHFLREWKNNDQVEGALLQGTSLAKAEEWLQKRPEELTSLEKGYIKQSIKFKKNKELKTIGSLTIGLVIVSFLAIFSFFQWQQTEIQRQQAITNKIQVISASSKILFDAGQSLPALQQSLKAAIEAQKYHDLQPEATIPLVTSLEEIVYNIKEKNRLDGHQAIVSSLTYNSHGDILISADFDNQIKIWQSDGKLLQTLEGDKEKFHTVTLSPNGELLVSVSLNQGVKFWQYNRSVKKFATTPYATIKQSISAVAWSPDSKLLLVGLKNGKIQLYNSKGKLLKEVDGHKDIINSLSFSLDGQFFASASGDKTVKLWRQKGQLLQTLQGHQGAVLAVSFSPSKGILASASDDQTIKIWNQQGKLLHTLKGHQAAVLQVNFSPDGQLLADAGEDKTVKVWQVTTGQIVETLKGHTESVSDVVFSPDGKTIASASHDKTIRLWDIQNSLPTYQNVDSLSYDTNGQFIVVTKGKVTLMSQDKKIIRSFPVETGTSLDVVPRRVVIKIGISPNNKIIATTDTKTVKLWTIEGKLIATLASASQFSFNPDSKSIATVTSDNNTVKLWGLDGQLLRTWQTGQKRITSISFSPDGKNLVTGDQTLKIWSLDGKLQQTISGNTNNILDIAYSSDGEIIATASGEKIVKLWSNNGKVSTTIKQSERVSSLSFIPNTHILVTGLEKGDLTFWNSKGQLLQTLSNSQDIPTQITFSPYGQELASIDSTGKLILRNLDIDLLVDKGCDWMKDYLANNSNLSATERELCREK